MLHGSAVAGGACAVCGRRRGTVRGVASDGDQSRGAVVCETCARELMVAQQGRAPAQQVSQLARDGFDEAFGARPMARDVRRTLEKALTQTILDGRLPAESKVRANLGQDGEVALELREPALAGAGQRR